MSNGKSGLEISVDIFVSRCLAVINHTELKSASVSWTGQDTTIQGKVDVISDDSRFSRLFRSHENNGSAKPTFYFERSMNVRMRTTCFHPGTCSFIREIIHGFKRCYTTFPDNLLNCFFSNVCVCQTIQILFKPYQTFSFTYMKTFISQFYQRISRICKIFSYVYIFIFNKFKCMTL